MGQPRILVVDDEWMLRDLVVCALSAAGYAVDFACDGTEGLRCALAGDYGLVILDLLMPDVDGRTLLTELVGAENHVTRSDLASHQWTGSR